VFFIWLCVVVYAAAVENIREGYNELRRERIRLLLLKMLVKSERDGAADTGAEGGTAGGDIEAMDHVLRGCHVDHHAHNTGGGGSGKSRLSEAIDRLEMRTFRLSSPHLFDDKVGLLRKSQDESSSSSKDSATTAGITPKEMDDRDDNDNDDVSGEPDSASAASSPGVLNDAEIEGDTNVSSDDKAEISRTFGVEFLKNWSQYSEERFVLEFLLATQEIDRKHAVEPLIKFYRNVKRLRTSS